MLVLDILQKEKPQTVKQLITLLSQKNKNLASHEIDELLVQLEHEGKLGLNRKVDPSPKNRFVIKWWYWASITVAMGSTLTIFFIPSNSYPFTYLRAALGLIILLFLPGFVCVKAIYPNRNPAKTSAQEIDTIERFVLSIGLSLALTSIVSITLYYTPFGLGIASVTLSLIVLTGAVSNFALLRENQAKVEDV